MFCRKCGAQMADDANFCPECGAKAGDGVSFCANCGKPAFQWAAVCNFCGADLLPQEENAQEPKQDADPFVSDQPMGDPFPQYGIDPQNPIYQPPREYEQKSRIAAGLLGIFLGAFGVHNFYLGFKGKAIAQLLITLLSFFTLSFISAIWGLIEGIIILTTHNPVDAKGVILKN